MGAVLFTEDVSLKKFLPHFFPGLSTTTVTVWCTLSAAQWRSNLRMPKHWMRYYTLSPTNNHLCCWNKNAPDARYAAPVTSTNMSPAANDTVFWVIYWHFDLILKVESCGNPPFFFFPLSPSQQTLPLFYFFASLLQSCAKPNLCCKKDVGRCFPPKSCGLCDRLKLEFETSSYIILDSVTEYTTVRDQLGSTWGKA